MTPGACRDASSIKTNPDATNAVRGLGQELTSVAGSAARPITERLISGSNASASLIARDGTLWDSPNPNRSTADVVVCWARSTQYGRTIDGDRLPETLGPVAELKQRVRRAVERTWSRYTNVYFSHWVTCGDESEPGKIVLAFADRNFADRGKHKSSPTRVYLDRKLTDLAAFEAAAIGSFGQALRFVAPDRSPQLPPTSLEILSSQVLYGMKYPGSLVDWTGSCVFHSRPAASSDPGYLVPAPCFAGVPEFVWRPVVSTDGTGAGLRSQSVLESTGAGCIQRFGASLGALLTVQGCGNAAAIEFSNFTWKSAAELCVAATALSPGATLELRHCDNSTAAMRWNFEFVGNTQIALSNGESCLAVAPTSPASGAPLTLAACEQSAIRPDFSPSAAIRFGGYCVIIEGGHFAPGSRLVLGACEESALASHFHVSGRLASDERCAAVNQNVPFGTYSVVQSTSCKADAPQIVALPSDPLEWDYYW